jgi:hypothetical protein
VSKEIPPIKMLATDSVSRLTPSAVRATSKPLAFQKRVSVRTRASCGACTKIPTATNSPEGSSSDDITSPTRILR